jgi:hypothetical protein
MMLIASVVLAVLGVLGNILLGRKIPIGWVLAIVNDGILLGMGVATGGYGLCALAGVNTVIAARNFTLWRRRPTPAADL